MVPRKLWVSENFSPISATFVPSLGGSFFACLVQKSLESRARIFKQGSQRVSDFTICHPLHWLLPHVSGVNLSAWLMFLPHTLRHGTSSQDVFFLPLQGNVAVAMSPFTVSKRKSSSVSSSGTKRFKTTSSVVSNEDPDRPIVYSDGCCTKNGRHGARAGVGVYWSQEHPK